VNIVVSDTSVLLNFLKIDRLDLLARCSYEFFITEHVESEISDYYPQQFRSFQTALQERLFHKTTLEHPAEMDLFIQLSRNQLLGKGESSAIAVAVHRNCALSIDDAKAIKSAKAVNAMLPIFQTQDLMVSFLEQGILDVSEADKILRAWAIEHRFKLKIETFAELVTTTPRNK
jgi:predicted nucleic acid-binding protein